MNVAFRVDSGTRIGSGHLMRCLTLAAALRRRGGCPHFLSRKLPGNLNQLVREQAFAMTELPEPDPAVPFTPDSEYAGWLGVSWLQDALDVVQQLELLRPQLLVVDSYALDARWEKLQRPHVGRILVIDDLADRPHDCDLLLDQNLCRGMENRYDALLPLGCRTFLGPSHALLRPEFRVAPQRRRDGQVRRLLVFLGGTDPDNVTAKVLAALDQVHAPELSADVVVGGSNPHREEIRLLCTRLPRVSYHCQVENMAQLMAYADLAVGAAGSACWERCSLGLPSLVLVLADNQEAVARGVVEAGAARLLGRGTEVTVPQITGALESLLADPAAVRELGERALQVMGKGGGGIDALLNALWENQP